MEVGKFIFLIFAYYAHEYTLSYNNNKEKI